MAGYRGDLVSGLSQGEEDTGRGPHRAQPSSNRQRVGSVAILRSSVSHGLLTIHATPLVATLSSAGSHTLEWPAPHLVAKA